MAELTTACKLGRPQGGRWDIADGQWAADYPDPFDLLNVLFSPTKNHVDFGGFDDLRFERRMNAAARLTGPRRYRAYARLDATSPVTTRRSPLTPTSATPTSTPREWAARSTSPTT